MDLAVGVIIGAAFQAIINSLVNDVISPLIGLFANTDLTYLSVMVGGCGNPLWCIFDRSDQFHHYGSDYFPDGKGMNALAGLGKKKEPEKPAVKMCPYCRSKVAAEATRCPYWYIYAGSKKEDKKKKINNRMHAERAFYCLHSSSESVRRLHPYNRSASRSARRWNWLIALILQIVDQVGKRLCGINGSGMEQEDRAVLELATV